MPANKKHLTASPWQRLLKVTAAFVGGYMVSMSFHLLLMAFMDRTTVFITMRFSVYILWAALMVIAFLAKNGWKIWGIYLGLSLIFFLPYLLKMMGK
ncbi:hypothetical protein SAMN05192529_10670 [Arachidicoccus rhizosphaerae]|jgi:hypothetical protein|uniref:Uncharacterized protein n=1 Tax=Arachidicoccus rhizosphaerae TaxID=551991 RepID=A0A1H3XRS9_9BACT|nr:hypothetical protein [Arachidicoccus rhizosphaerae]SEA01940.1 hypothetical protein SAMN05192529_10670 [Arachidicoccus rhizosphaerae]